MGRRGHDGDVGQRRDGAAVHHVGERGVGRIPRHPKPHLGGVENLGGERLRPGGTPQEAMAAAGAWAAAHQDDAMAIAANRDLNPDNTTPAPPATELPPRPSRWCRRSPA